MERGQPLSHHPGGLPWTQSAGAQKQPFSDIYHLWDAEQQAEEAGSWILVFSPFLGPRKMLLEVQRRTARVSALASAAPSIRSQLTPYLLLLQCRHLKRKCCHLENALHLLKGAYIP